MSFPVPFSLALFQRELASVGGVLEEVGVALMKTSALVAASSSEEDSERTDTLPVEISHGFGFELVL